MAYCQECGSEVAPEDAFCPYCGIVLQSVIPSEESRPNVEPSVDSSVSKPLEDTVKPSIEETYQDKPSQAVSSPIEEQKSSDEPVSANENSFPFQSDEVNESPADIAPEPEQSEAENEVWDKTVEVSADAQIEDYSVTNQPETQDKPEVSEKNEYFSEAEAVKTEFDDEISINEEINEPIAEKEQISAESVGNLEDETGNSAIETPADKEEKEEEWFPPLPELSELTVDPESSDVAMNAEADQQKPAESYKDEDFSATIPYTPQEFSKNEPEEKSFSSESNEKVLEAVSDSLNKEQFFGENQSAQASATDTVDKESEFKFDTPQNPLPVAEKAGSTPVFITIQPKEEPEIAEQTPVIEPKIEASVPPVVEAKEGRSYTSPNIGVSDTDGKKAAKLKPLDEGTVLNGRYEIVRKIGGGGMGAVYLASDQNLGGVLRAVKEMVQSYIEDEQQEKAVNDFRRESMILSTLDHPSIPTIYDYFYDEKESRFYLVMKYINGGDLAARLRSAPEGRLDEKTVTEWAIQIADVLDYLHNRPTTIIYRDLKPSNVMIDGNSGRIMLIDFGIARSVNKEEKGVTAVGTMGYAPPELFSGNVEPRSDIYSLGSTIFHLLTGADPQSNPLLIFDFNKNPRPRQINSRLSDQIEQILMRAVEYNSGQRFNSAAEMREILKQHLENLQKGTVTYGVSSATAAKAQISANAPVFCGFCGQKIVATDMFCPFCGAKQPSAMQAQAAPSAQSFVAPKLTARLMVIGTNELDAPEFSLEKDNNLVGRRDPMSNIFPEVDLSKFDPQTKISRKHARIWKENNSYLLEDLGSSNGTVLMPAAKDSVRLLPRQPHVLTHGDKIRVGDTTLHFFIG